MLQTAAPRPETVVSDPAPVAATLAKVVAQRSLLFVAADEGRATAVAAVLAAFAPDAEVVHLPASAGARVAALRRLRIAREAGTPVACIASAEATAPRIAPPDAFDAAPRVRLLACAARVAKVDAGPAAVAFTPRPGVALAAVDGLVEKNGRWLLAERIKDAGARLDRVREVLEALAE